MSALTVGTAVPEPRLAPALRAALLFVLRADGEPTRAAADASGHADAVAELIERRYLRPAPTSLSRLSLSLRGRGLAVQLDELATR